MAAIAFRLAALALLVSCSPAVIGTLPPDAPSEDAATDVPPGGLRLPDDWSRPGPHWSVGAELREVPGSIFEIASRSSYDVERWTLSLSGMPEGRARVLTEFFGSRDEYWIRRQLEDIHRPITDEFLSLAGPSLRAMRWEGRYLLVLDVQGLRFDTHREEGEWVHTLAQAQVRLELRERQSDQLLLDRTRQVIYRKEQPGGRQTLQPLHRKLAEALYGVLSEAALRDPRQPPSPAD
ncbi:hypothetical protein ACFL6X_06390 [Candidatus Latescibacterota bacterium]